MESQEEPTAICDNCDKAIAESKLFLHEAYCLRNIIKCSKCNEPIHKNEVDIHENEVHRLTSCRFCRGNFEANQIKSHMENCPQKPKMCSFCKCEISSDEFNEHAYQCGSRTRKCTYCNKNVLVRDLEDHETICAVEQFSRESAGTRRDEEVKEDLLEDMLSQPRHKQSAPDSKLIFKKNLDALKRETQKKKLTKLADKKESNVEDQEVDDEELARALNREFYEGGKAAKHRQGRGKLIIDDDEDGDEVHDLVEEKPKEVPRTQNNTRQAARMDTRSSIEKQLDDEFFGVKRNTRTKMEIEKEDESAGIGRRTRNQIQNQNQNKNRNQQGGGRLKRNATGRTQESYYEHDDAEPENFEDFGEQFEETHHEQDPELAQFLSEDAELQRAIQASLEQQ